MLIKMLHFPPSLLPVLRSLLHLHGGRLQWSLCPCKGGDAGVVTWGCPRWERLRHRNRQMLTGGRGVVLFRFAGFWKASSAFSGALLGPCFCFPATPAAYHTAPLPLPPARPPPPSHSLPLPGSSFLKQFLWAVPEPQATLWVWGQGRRTAGPSPKAVAINGSQKTRL